jgi:hypothetical protein
MSLGAGPGSVKRLRVALYQVSKLEVHALGLLQSRVDAHHLLDILRFAETLGDFERQSSGDETISGSISTGLNGGVPDRISSISLGRVAGVSMSANSKCAHHSSTS